MLTQWQPCHSLPDGQPELVVRDLTKKCLPNSSQFGKNMEKKYVYILTQHLKIQRFGEVISTQKAILRAILGQE